jgi:hypothetical protein
MGLKVGSLVASRVTTREPAVAKLAVGAGAAAAGRP